jgi:hypothetical protein
MMRVSACGALVDGAVAAPLLVAGDSAFRGGGGGAESVRAGALASGAIAPGGGAAEGRALIAGGGGTTLVTWPCELASMLASGRCEPRTITCTPPTSC